MLVQRSWKGFVFNCYLVVGLPFAILEACLLAMVGPFNVMFANSAAAPRASWIGGVTGYLGGAAWIVILVRRLSPQGIVVEEERKSFITAAMVVGILEVAIASGVTDYCTRLDYNSVWFDTWASDLIDLLIVGCVAGAPLGYLGAKQLLQMLDRWRALDDEQPRCRNCGYSLRGASSKQCPECGAHQ